MMKVGLDEKHTSVDAHTSAVNILQLFWDYRLLVRLEEVTRDTTLAVATGLQVISATFRSGK